MRTGSQFRCGPHDTMTSRLRSLILVSTALGLLGGCDSVAKERVLEPDTNLRPLPQPERAARDVA